jgi:hypothetical protein
MRRSLEDAVGLRCAQSLLRRFRRDGAQMQTTTNTRAIQTTLGEWAAAYYQAALAELNNADAAALLTQQMLMSRTRRR